MASFNDLDDICEILPKSLYLTNWFAFIIIAIKNRESADNLEALKSLGITHILNITSETGKYEDLFTYYCIGNI